jgi:citrate synthase
MPDPLMSAREAARHLGVKPATIYAYVSRGVLVGQPRVRGKGRVYARAEIERLKQRSRAKAGEVAAAALSYGVPILDSSLTVIDPVRGPLYRGESAVDLAARGVRFESVACLLWGAHEGDTDARAPIAPAPRIFTRNEGPAAGLDALLFALRRASPPVVGDAAREHARAAALLRELAVSLCWPLEPARRERAHAQPSLARAALVALGARDSIVRSAERDVDRALVLLADHEVAPSTFAARIAASTGADLVGCVHAALSVHAGPRHGGACDRIEALFDDVERATEDGTPLARAAERVVVARLERGDDVPGFFRALYPHGDPRARAMMALPACRPARPLADAVERARTKLFGDDTPLSVDATLVTLCRALALPRGSATALFALGRSAGWIAHVLEQRAAGHVLRPRARAAGSRADA